MPLYISEENYYAAAKRMHASDYLQLLTTIYHDDPFFPLSHFFDSIDWIREKFLFFDEPTPDITVDREKETIWYPDIEADDGSKIKSHVSDEFDVILRRIIPIIITYIKNLERRWAKRDFNEKKELLRTEIGELLESDENKKTIKKYPIIKEHLRPLLQLLDLTVTVKDSKLVAERLAFFSIKVPDDKLRDFRDILIEQEIIETIGFRAFRDIMYGKGQGTILCKPRTGNHVSYLLDLLRSLTPYRRKIKSKAPLYFSGLPKNFRNSTGLSEKTKRVLELAVKKLQ
jgi:hypothetical protein